MENKRAKMATIVPRVNLRIRAGIANLMEISVEKIEKDPSRWTESCNRLGFRHVSYVSML